MCIVHAPTTHSLLSFNHTHPQVWNLENMLPILALQRHEKPVRSLAIYRDSVFTGSEDMEIKVSNNNTPGPFRYNWGIVGKKGKEWGIVEE